MNSQEQVIISHTYLLPSKTVRYSSSQTKHTLTCFQTIFPPQGKREFPTQHPDHAKVKTHLKHVSQCSGAVWIYNLRPVPLGHIKTCHTIVFWVREECYKINISPSDWEMFADTFTHASRFPWKSLAKNRPLLNEVLELVKN